MSELEDEREFTIRIGLVLAFICFLVMQVRGCVIEEIEIRNKYGSEYREAAKIHPKPNPRPHPEPQARPEEGQ